MVEVVALVTEYVVTLKAALDWPEGTVTVAGTVAAAVLLLVNVTLMFDVAEVLRVTVPVEGLPPVTVEGLSVTEVTVVEVDPEEQPGKTKDAIRVIQLKLPFEGRYSFVYQKVQSSVGSTDTEL